MLKFNSSHLTPPANQAQHSYVRQANANLNLVRRRTLLGIMLAACTPLQTHASARSLSVYIVPQFPAEEIFSTWSPLLQSWGQIMGVRFEIKIARTIPEFERLFCSGLPDIAYMNPYHAVMANHCCGYQPIIYDSGQSLSGILLVKKNSPIQQLSDLSNQEIVFPAPNALGASLYLRALLTEKEKLPFTARYVTTHSNVFRQIISGMVKAGGAVPRTLMLEQNDIAKQLRVLYETPAVASHPIVVHPRLGKSMQEQLRSTFLQLASDSANKTILQNIDMRQPRGVNYEKYQPIERLGLEKYVVNTIATI